MITARHLITFITDVAIADTDEIAAEFGLTPHEADNAAWNADLHWTMGATRDEPVVWQPRWGEDLEENLAAFQGDLDAPLSLADIVGKPTTLPPAMTSDDAPAIAAPTLEVRVTELGRIEAQAYLDSGYNPKLETTIARVADRIVDLVRDLVVGERKPLYVTVRAIVKLAEAKHGTSWLPNYNTVRKVANALGATGRLTRKGGGKGGQWKFGVPA